MTGDVHEIRIDKVWQVKSHIGTLKLSWAWSEAAMWFADGLTQESLADINVEENWLSSEDQALHVEKDLMNKERKEAENIKNDMEEVQDALEQHAEDIQTTDEAIREKKIRIQEMLTVLEEKMEKLKKLKERQQLLEGKRQQHASINGYDSASNNVHLKEKLEQTCGALRQCTAAVDSLTEHTALLETDRNIKQNTLKTLEENLSTLTAEQEKSMKSPELEWIHLQCNFMNTCGLRVVNISDDWIEIEIVDIYDDDDANQETSILQLTVHFCDNDGRSVLIKDVTAKRSLFFIKDLIDQLKSTNDIKVFSLEVQERFHSHVKLLKEMKLLQKRFAIDWNEDEQIVRVMVGRAGQIVCTLKVQHGYPNGDVTVMEIHGADPAIIFQDSLVTKELRTLTNWIEYLDIKYSSQAE